MQQLSTCRNNRGVKKQSMDMRYILGGILAALIGLAILVEIVCWLSRRRRDRAARAYLAQHPQGRSYAVGSPEYNAQVVAAIRQVNERLEPQGKRVPERAAMEIITKQMEEGK
jgi:hypothetical protein